MKLSVSPVKILVKKKEREISANKGSTVSHQSSVEQTQEQRDVRREVTKLNSASSLTKPPWGNGQQHWYLIFKVRNST